MGARRQAFFVGRFFRPSGRPPPLASPLNGAPNLRSRRLFERRCFGAVLRICCCRSSSTAAASQHLCSPSPGAGRPWRFVLAASSASPSASVRGEHPLALAPAQSGSPHWLQAREASAIGAVPRLVQGGSMRQPSNQGHSGAARLTELVMRHVDRTGRGPDPIDDDPRAPPVLVLAELNYSTNESHFHSLQRKAVGGRPGLISRLRRRSIFTPAGRLEPRAASCRVIEQDPTLLSAICFLSTSQPRRS